MIYDLPPTGVHIRSLPVFVHQSQKHAILWRYARSLDLSASIMGFTQRTVSRVVTTYEPYLILQLFFDAVMPPLVYKYPHVNHVDSRSINKERSLRVKLLALQQSRRTAAV